MYNHLFKIVIIILILSSTPGCNKNSSKDKKSISISLAQVYSNLTIEKLDTYFILPNLGFMLVFNYEGDSTYLLSFNEMYGAKDETHMFYTLIDCPNKKKMKLNLYPYSRKKIILKKDSKDTLFFRVKSPDIIHEFEKCSDEYLGGLIEKCTRNMTFFYKDSLNNFKVSCIRQGFEAPKDNSAIE